MRGWCLLLLSHGPPLPPARAPFILQKNHFHFHVSAPHRFLCLCVHCRLYTLIRCPSNRHQTHCFCVNMHGRLYSAEHTHTHFLKATQLLCFFCFPHPSLPLPSVSAPARLSVFLRLFLTLPSSSSSSVPLRHSLCTLMYDAMKQNVTVNFFPLTLFPSDPSLPTSFLLSFSTSFNSLPLPRPLLLHRLALAVYLPPLLLLHLPLPPSPLISLLLAPPFAL